MVQPDAQITSSHVVINVDAEAEPRCCCVCMEPLQWVALGRCRHRDVCAGCAIRIRFFRGDLRCCVCRTYCFSVLVTRVDTRDHLPRLPLAFGPWSGKVGYYWYHGGTGAYFDDQNQYEMATKSCVKPPPPPDHPELNNNSGAGAVNYQLGAPSQPAAGADDRSRRHDKGELSTACLGVVFVGIYLCVILMLIVMCGLVFFVGAEHYYQKVAIAIAFGLLSAAATIFAIWEWPKFKDHIYRDA